MSDTEVSRYRAAAGVLNDLGEQEILPRNEGQTRELVGLKSASRRQQVWTEVLKRHQEGERITAALIRAVVGGKKKEKKRKDSGKGKSRLKLAKVVTSHLTTLSSMSLGRIDAKDLEAVLAELKVILTTATKLEGSIKDALGKYNAPAGF